MHRLTAQSGCIGPQISKQNVQQLICCSNCDLRHMPDCSCAQYLPCVYLPQHEPVIRMSLLLSGYWYHGCHKRYLLLLQACAAPPQLLALQQELAPLELSRAGEASPPPLHDPTRQLLFCDFCEALVRVAHLKYRHLPSLQQRLHHLLHGHILPLAVQVSTSCCCCMHCCYHNRVVASRVYTTASTLQANCAVAVMIRLSDMRY